MKKCKELILHLDDSVDRYCFNVSTNYVATLSRINNGDQSIRTTIPHFLSFQYAERLFVVFNNEMHEITLGDCEGTNREIREGHNIEKLLIAGEFDWFR